VSDAAQQERTRNLMMAALDGELSPAEHDELERALAADGALRAEWGRLRRVKEVTGAMGYSEPPSEVWDEYWTDVYRRLERRTGWILASAGALILCGWALWAGLEALLADHAMPLVVKIGIFALLFGGVILFVSVLREKLFTYRADRYREVRR